MRPEISTGITQASGLGWRSRGTDSLLIILTGLLAGCGLVYEYLLAHYAARVLGAVETVIYTVISLMIVSMGVGAFLARYVRDPFKAFVRLEITLAVAGGAAVLLTAAVMAVSYDFPSWLNRNFSLTLAPHPHGGFFGDLYTATTYLPYLAAVFLGGLVGMEIPLLARVREKLHDGPLPHNFGTLYGADYIGAGVGAVLWIGWMITLPPVRAAAFTAGVNLILGAVFLLLFRRELSAVGRWLFLHAVVAGGVVFVALQGPGLHHVFEDMMYADRVVFRQETNYQRLVVTERSRGPDLPPLHSFHLNGRVQFSTSDEVIYHEMLVSPAFMASARNDKVLIVGGGDGLALRDALKWQPKTVRLLELDPDIVRFFAEPRRDGKNAPFLDLNARAYSDPRVTVDYGDAFVTADKLIRDGARFDVIIVDLPDPHHPDLNKLYSTAFYGKLRQLLQGDGAMTVQSTSPYHAKRTFISIGKTIAASGFTHSRQYRAHVPSFGEWGWTLALPFGAPPDVRLRDFTGPLPTRWATKSLIEAAFEFPKGYFDVTAEIAVNRPLSGQVYRYHLEDWRVSAPDPG